MAGVKRRLCSELDIHALHKELDEVSCPICMDHPHNAVLLLCSSHEKGCRSYICDTSYRHSNCLDRFKKLRDNCGSDVRVSSPLLGDPLSTNNTSDASLTMSTHVIGSNGHNNPIENNIVTSVALPEGSMTNQNSAQDLTRSLEMHGENIFEAGDFVSLRERTGLEEDAENSSESVLPLKCPLCRGAILGWEVVGEARKYLNMKKRSCSRESCSFYGNYQELRRHARRVHPTTRPGDIDPSRERAWRCIEHQREYGDIVSAIRSAMPGAVVVGDYVIENGDRLSMEREHGANEANASWWTTLLLFRMVGSVNGVAESRSRSRAWTRHRQSGGALPERRFLWGENLLGLHDDDYVDDDLHVLSDAGEDASPIPRRRRRLNRTRSDDRS